MFLCFLVPAKIKVDCKNPLGKMVYVKCNTVNTMGDLKKLTAPQMDTCCIKVRSPVSMLLTKKVVHAL